jgi:hypothetical protein
MVLKMKDEKAKIVLFCVNCNKESPHTVYYIGNYLRSVVCDNCNKKIEIDRRHLKTVFAEEFINRILTKPHRVTEDMKKAIATLMPFFPKRLFKEPLKVMKEIYAVLKKENGNSKKRSK